MPGAARGKRPSDVLPLYLVPHRRILSSGPLVLKVTRARAMLHWGLLMGLPTLVVWFFSIDAYHEATGVWAVIPDPITWKHDWTDLCLRRCRSKQGQAAALAIVFWIALGSLSLGVAGAARKGTTLLRVDREGALVLTRRAEVSIPRAKIQGVRITTWPAGQLWRGKPGRKPRAFTLSQVAVVIDDGEERPLADGHGYRKAHAFARAVARRLGVPVTIRRRDVKGEPILDDATGHVVSR